METLIFTVLNRMMKNIKFLMTLLGLIEFVTHVHAQGLFETGGEESENNMGRRIELNGYGRGTLYIGEKDSNTEISSGYAEAAFRMKFIPDRSVTIFSEFRLRGGYEYGSRILEPVLRELYADIYFGRLDFRLGHQIIVWGRADGINPTDNLTPGNYFVRSPEPDDMRLGNYLFRGRYRLTENIRLEGIWVPFYRYSIYRFDLFEMPGYVKFKDTEHLSWESSGGNTGLKAEFLFRGIDGSVSWFSGFDPQPGIDIDHLGMKMTGDIDMDLAAAAYRHHTIGADFAIVAGSFGIRGEAGLRIPVNDYRDKIFTPETDFRYVFGVDRSVGNFNIMVQYIGQWVPDYQEMPELMLFQESEEMTFPETLSYTEIPAMIDEQIKGFNRIIHGQTHRVSHTFSLRPSLDLMYHTLKIDVFAMYNLSTEEVTVMPKLTYSVSDYWSISLGGQYFDGPENTLNDFVGPVFNGGFLEVRRSF
jgi:hypothetical protein